MSNTHWILDNLLEYLTPKLTRKSIETHKNLGFKACEYLESILDENLTVTFGRETFDQYGGPLVYLGDGQEMYTVHVLLFVRLWLCPYLVI